MAHPTMTRDALVDKLSVVFREHGYEGASLARLSEATGLVKASLYYQFPRGKVDMARAVLDALGDEIGRNVVAPLADASRSPRARLERMAEGLAQVYDGGRSFCVVDVFGIGESGLLFREHLKGAVAAIGGALSALLREVGLPPDEATRRAEDALIAIQGSLVLARATDDPAAFLRVLRDWPQRLLGTQAADTVA